MYKLLCVLPVLIAGCVSTGQNPPSQAGNPLQSDASKAEISGQVVDSATGQPLKKAWVSARQLDRSPHASTAVTDRDGHFLVKDIEPGRYTVSVQRNGYVSQTYGQKGPGDQGITIALIPGQKLTDIVFRLIQGGVISGRIVDEDSEPIAHVFVQALQFRYLQGRRRLTPVGNAMSDDRGEYRIFGVRPGQVYVRATLRGFAMYGGSGEAVDATAPTENSSYPPVFYPNVQDASQASALTIRGGDELHADFSMTPQHSYSVSGRVVGGVQGTSGRGAFLMLMKRSEGEFAFGPGINAMAGEDNAFTFKQVLPGAYYLVAQQQADNSSATARVEVDVKDSNVEGLAVALSPKVEVTGRIIFENNANAKPTSVHISLSPEDAQDFMRGAYAQPKDDGSFTFQVPPDERYKISIFGAPPDMYLRSVAAGREDVLEKGFSASSSHTLDLTFTAGSKLMGTINASDGTGEPGVTVVLVPDRKLAGLADVCRTATTDQNGKYQIQGLRPGAYHAYAFEHIEPGAYEDEEWLKRFADQAHSLRISEGGQETLDLKPIPATSTEGTL
jgi:hypothetical protein